MPRFDANLTLLWPELDVYERFGRAAAAGFSRVEILFVHSLDLMRVKTLLGELHLELLLFDPRAGDWDDGERGLLTVPGRQVEFLDTVRDAVQAAQLLGTRYLNTLAGIPPPGVTQAAALDTALENLNAAAPLAEAAGITLLVENINTTDFPGYFADTPQKAAQIVNGVGRSSVRLQLDQYHVGMMGLDPRAALREYLNVIAHVQVADVPGRHEPGSGHQPITAFLADLDSLGYQGNVGLEYRPAADTDAGLNWLPRDQRA